jgi:hypothetical protein
MRLWVAGVIAAVAVFVGLLAEHLGHGWEQPAWIPILDIGIGWVLVGSGLVGAIARPSQPAGRRLVLAGFLWFVGTPQQAGDPIVDALAFGFQGYYDLVLMLIVLSFPARWPSRREERAILSRSVSPSPSGRWSGRWPKAATPPRRESPRGLLSGPSLPGPISHWPCSSASPASWSFDVGSSRVRRYAG